MRLRNGSFNTINLNTDATNTFQIGQAVVAQTFISGDYGVIVPPSCDDDNDGVPNGLDLDSDGDGIKDITESNGTDADNDGKADGAVDSNGVPATANGGLTPPNTDTTGNSNPYDTDSDGDGISESIDKATRTSKEPTPKK